MNRDLQLVKTQGVVHVYMPVTVLSAGTGTPTMSEGDPGGSYYTVARVSAGNYTLTTKDAFTAIVHKNIVLGAGWRAVLGVASQNSNGTWTMPFYTIQDPSSIASITVTAAGTGYTSLPTIAYNNAHGNTGLVAVATLSAGTIASIAVTNGGFGTDGTAPTLTISGGGGSGGTATTTMGSGAAADPTSGRAMRFQAVFRNSSVTP